MHSKQAILRFITLMLLAAWIASSPLAQALDKTDHSQGPKMSRVAPAQTPPIIIDHIQYGDSSGYNGHFLPIIDTRSGKVIDRIEIYRYPIVPELETDVQDVFFKSMSRINGGKELLIENERGHQFVFDIRSRKPRELNHSCILRLVEAEKVGSQWKVLVELSTTNILPAENFYLDRISFGDTQDLMNNLFAVKSQTTELEYRGEMAKRAPPAGVEHLSIARPPGGAKRSVVPDAFILIEPGQSHQVTIDIGKHYWFPVEGGTFSVQYRHHNHFSPNHVDLISNTISVTLAPNSKNTPPKKP